MAVPVGISAYRVAHTPERADNRPVEKLREGYVSSRTCGACHPGEYDSWHHSWHRTMTQVASPESVFGNFDDVNLEWYDTRAILTRRGDHFFVRTFDWDLQEVVRRRIVLTTGSHWMQVYWYTRGPGKTLGQLPFTYLKAEERWVPREAVFLRPPSNAPRKEGGRWNEVCVQCHTTRGRPGLELESRDSLAAKSDAVEFGIACEACHGPGTEHVAANRSNPARRYAQHLFGADDPTIVNPPLLTQTRSTEVCGQCHGIHPLPKDDYYSIGHTYKAGDVLEETGRIIARGGPGSPYHTDSLFWPDGMVRVGGREMNGLVESPCYQRGEMTCLSCHSMHKAGDDPRSYEQWADDQLQSGMRGNGACLQCHKSLAANIEGHSHHPAGSSGSECMNCHMPYTSWNLMKATRQHEIDIPSVRATLRTRRPNACNACHIDQTLSWSARKLFKWYQQKVPKLSRDEKTIAASLLWLLKGEAGQRALAAWYLGWPAAREASGSDWIAPHLAQLLEDPFDVVRYAAAASLRSLPGFEEFEYDYLRRYWWSSGPPRSGSFGRLTGASDRARATHAMNRADRASAAQPAYGSERLLLRPDGSLNRLEVERLVLRRDDRAMQLLE